MAPRQAPQTPQPLPSARLWLFWRTGKPVRRVLWLFGLWAVLFGWPTVGASVWVGLVFASFAVHYVGGHMSGLEIRSQLGK